MLARETVTLHDGAHGLADVKGHKTDGKDHQGNGDDLDGLGLGHLLPDVGILYFGKVCPQHQVGNQGNYKGE